MIPEFQILHQLRVELVDTGPITIESSIWINFHVAHQLVRSDFELEIEQDFVLVLFLSHRIKLTRKIDEKNKTKKKRFHHAFEQEDEKIK